MPNPIHTLSEQLANQIAAGEVIERPASVVKELLENSLDAGARRIEIDLEKGGLRLIRIRDNGEGIWAADLAKALMPHATSKIRALEDLDAIDSLGFRGEALASIQAVSRLRLVSKPAEQEHGMQVTNTSPEKQANPQSFAHPQGTTVEVADLFYNTPARRKFMRSERTEFNHVDAIIKRLALSHYEVSIQVTHDGKIIRRFRAAATHKEQSQRVANILGQAFMDEAIRFEIEGVGIGLKGWVSTPQYTRVSNDQQCVYLNGRFIRDRLISHAIRQAYQGLLTEGVNPAYVLYLTVEPHSVDVNVHPTKHEVRFRESRLVHDFVVNSVRGVLTQEATATAETGPHEYSRPASMTYGPSSGTPRPMQVAEQVAHYATMAQMSMGDDTRQGTQDRETSIAPISVASERSVLYLKDRYAILEQAEGLKIINLKATQTQRFLECAQAQFENAGALESRPLLIPETLTLKRPKEGYEPLFPLIETLGFDLCLMPGAQSVVRRCPELIKGSASQVLSSFLERALVKQWHRVDTQKVILHLAEVVQVCDQATFNLGVENAELVEYALSLNKDRQTDVAKDIVF